MTVTNMVASECVGKDCRMCETCIYDEPIELFIPDKEKKDEKQNKFNDKMNSSTRLCNDCVNLVKDDAYSRNGAFDAICKACTYQAFGRTNPRKIRFSAQPDEDIVTPQWCPIMQAAMQLAGYKPIPSTSPSTPASTTENASLSYTEKRERMKDIRRHVQWDEIEEGKMYVIPKIMSQPRKIVKVITKLELSCICHEISEYTGNEYTYNTVLYPSDLNSILIAELKTY